MKMPKRTRTHEGCDRKNAHRKTSVSRSKQICDDASGVCERRRTETATEKSQDQDCLYVSCCSRACTQQGESTQCDEIDGLSPVHFTQGCLKLCQLDFSASKIVENADPDQWPHSPTEYEQGDAKRCDFSAHLKLDHYALKT